MIAGTKILKHLDRLSGDYRPITADVFVTDYCNNACPYCNFVRYEQRHGQYMQYPDFVQYVQRLIILGVKGIIFTGGGEPTINPDFEQMVSYLEANQIKYGINTNFNEYRDCNPVYLKVSLDGYDKESYKAFRGVDKYEQVKNNIYRFKENHPNTNLGIQHLAQSVEDVERFIENNEHLPVDYIVIRPVESCGGQYYKDQNNIDTALRIMETVKGWQNIDSRIQLNYKFSFLRDAVDSCPAHWSQIAINTRGDVMYCCHKPHEIIGHIMDTDILKKHCKAVYNINTCDIPCRLTGPNAMLRSIASVEESAFL